MERERGRAVIVDVESVLESEELRRLFEAAEERGRRARVAAAEVLEPLELDELERELVYRELEKRAIEVVDDGDEAS